MIDIIKSTFAKAAIGPIKNSTSLTEEIFLLIEDLEEKLLLYQAGTKRYRAKYDEAVQISIEEIAHDFKKILSALTDKNKGDIPLEILTLGNDLIGSSIWITRSYLRYLKSFLRFHYYKSVNSDHQHENILNQLKKAKSLEDITASPSEVFKCVFEELCFEHENEHYLSPLKFPQINTTIVLISGVLNELYKTAAFERGAQYLNKNYGIKYFTTEVSGRKGSTHNARLIEKQLIEYIEKHPNEKLWLVAYSKGGVDTLHFLKRSPEFAQRHIAGISTIASPIQGSPHADSRLVRLIKTLNKFEHNSIYRKLDGGRDLLLQNVPRFLSEKFQVRWFERNKKYLPNNIFYSSLALESEWYKAHIWMLLAKLVFRSKKPNDGVVDVDRAHFPDHFDHINLGVIKGHHLVSTRSSTFNQEALIEAHLITLHYLGVLD